MDVGCAEEAGTPRMGDFGLSKTGWHECGIFKAGQVRGKHLSTHFEGQIHAASKIWGDAVASIPVVPFSHDTFLRRNAPADLVNLGQAAFLSPYLR